MILTRQEYNTRKDSFHTPITRPNKDIQPCTIILVDDDQDDRDLTIRALKKSEYVKDIKPLPDGEDFITFLKNHGFYDRSVLCLRPILVLLDMQMPRMNGLEVLREIKSDAFLRDIPVVVLSSLKNDRKIMEAFQLGADGYLLKPLDATRLEGFMNMSWSWPPKELWS